MAVENSVGQRVRMIVVITINSSPAKEEHHAGTFTDIPRDEFNQQLEANVHPPNWINPTPQGRYNLVVIGAGTAGLVTAAGAAGLGAKVALIERSLRVATA